MIYYSDDTKQKIAQSYIQQLQSTGSFVGAIATQVEPLVRFHPVVDSEQDYTLKHPASPYVLGVGVPKLAALKSIFPSLYPDAPVTLSGSSPS